MTGLSTAGKDSNLVDLSARRVARQFDAMSSAAMVEAELQAARGLRMMRLFRNLTEAQQDLLMARVEILAEANQMRLLKDL